MPDLGWETALERYELLGGHPLWIAPDPDRPTMNHLAGPECSVRYEHNARRHGANCSERGDACARR